MQNYTEILKLALLIVGIVALAVVLLSVKVILQPKGKFSSMHIGDSPAMRQRGIHCVQSMDAMERKANPHRVTESRRKDERK